MALQRGVGEGGGTLLPIMGTALDMSCGDGAAAAAGGQGGLLRGHPGVPRRAYGASGAADGRQVRPASPAGAPCINDGQAIAKKVSGWRG